MKTYKPARWFRMYAEFLTDPKVQMLSEVTQRRYIMLLCMRCSNGDVTLQDDQVAFQLRISNEEWLETKGVLTSIELINEQCQPTSWDKRQYASDSSAERVARHREKVKRDGNVTVTSPEKEKEKEKEKETERKTKPSPSQVPDGFVHFWSVYPRKQQKSVALAAYMKAGINGNLDTILAALERQKKSDQWVKDDGKFIPFPATWLNQRRWEDEVQTTRTKCDGIDFNSPMFAN
jgi:hypothetical protein